MPTVLRLDGFEFRIFPADHEPAHVHVIYAGVEAKVALGDEDTAPSSLDAKRMPTPDVRRAIKIVAEHQGALLVAWRHYHG